MAYTAAHPIRAASHAPGDVPATERRDGATTVPFPNGAWSAGDQGTFVGACEGPASTSYCKWPLRVVMIEDPNTHKLPGSVLVGGMTAAQHKDDFPTCHG